MDAFIIIIVVVRSNNNYYHHYDVHSIGHCHDTVRVAVTTCALWIVRSTKLGNYDQTFEGQPGLGFMNKEFHALGQPKYQQLTSRFSSLARTETVTLNPFTASQRFRLPGQSSYPQISLSDGKQVQKMTSACSQTLLRIMPYSHASARVHSKTPWVMHRWVSPREGTGRPTIFVDGSGWVEWGKDGGIIYPNSPCFPMFSWGATIGLLLPGSYIRKAGSYCCRTLVNFVDFGPLLVAVYWQFSTFAV